MSSANLAALPPELIFHVLEFLDDTPHNVHAIAQTNKELYGAAKRQLCSRKTIDVTIDPKAWLEDQELLRFIRHLRVVDSGASYTVSSIYKRSRDDGSFTSAFGHLATFISRLRNLKSIDWMLCRAVPKLVLDAIHKHPQVSLSIDQFIRYDPKLGELDTHELALATSPALTSIGGSASNVGGLDVTQAALRRIISLAPNLKTVHFGRDVAGCVALSWDNEAWDELQARDGLLTKNMTPNQSIRELSWEGGLVVMNWTDSVSFEHLEKFRCYASMNPERLSSTLSMLQSLKELWIDLSLWPDSDEASAGTVLKAYFTNCQPLECVTLWSWKNAGLIDLPSLLSRHGSSLRDLQLHQRDEPDSFRKAISQDEMRLIKEKCVNLRNLTIDLNRKSEVPKVSDHGEIFALLQSMHLSRLQVYLDLGISDQSPAPPIAEDIESWVVEAWKMLFSTTPSSQTKELVVKVGEWEREVDTGYPAGWVLMESANRSRWVAKTHERDDLPGECALDTSIKNYSEYNESSGRKELRYTWAERGAKAEAELERAAHLPLPDEDDLDEVHVLP